VKIRSIEAPPKKRQTPDLPRDESERNVRGVPADSKRQQFGGSRVVKAEGWTSETLADAQAEDERRIAALMNCETAIAAILESCGNPDPCGSVPCFKCARRFRRRLRGELRRLARRPGRTREWATIYLETVRAGSLQYVSIKRAHDRLRAQLRRSGFGSSVVVGGTEVAWIERDKVWVLHVHALAIDVDSDAWDALEEKLAKSGRGTPLVVDDLNDRERQLSYTQKFVTYHRPGRRIGTQPARAYPLPRDRFVELVRWWMGHRFEDFPFLYGVRRRGRQIVDA
jgi:hypothetical protein